MRHLNFQNPCMYSCLTHLLQQPCDGLSVLLISHFLCGVQTYCGDREKPDKPFTSGS